MQDVESVTRKPAQRQSGLLGKEHCRLPAFDEKEMDMANNNTVGPGINEG